MGNAQCFYGKKQYLLMYIVLCAISYHNIIMIYAGTKNGVDFGFYLEKEGLKSYTEMSNEEHMKIMDGQARGKVITFAATGQPSLIDPPPPSMEELADKVRQQRDTKIAAIQWRLDRYRNQQSAGLKTDDDADWYLAALLYVQALRDVPTQPGFPADVNWPTG